MRGQIQNYASVAKADPAKHMLVVGPWLHGVNRNRVVGERDGGPDAIIDLNRLRDRWLDARMLGAASPKLPNVLYFLPVKNEWRTAGAWPIPGTEFAKFYLESGGKVFPLAVELFPTSTYFEAGHRIRIEVAGSDFPNFGRNLNTMNSDAGTEIRVAHDRVEHTAAFPSHIVVPIVPAGSTQAWRGMPPRAGRDH